MSHPAKLKMTRILLVDDHAMVREGLAEAIARERDLIVCGEAADAVEAMELANSARPQLAIVDLTLKNSSGLELIREFQTRHPEIQVLVLSMHDESLYAERAIRAGARGYMNKAEATQNFLRAIRHVLAGKIYLSDATTRQVAAKALGKNQAEFFHGLEQLSDRELEIFQHLGEGKSPRQIANEINLDCSTVETYRTRIREKLEFKDANELLQAAIRWNKSQPG